MSAEKDIEVIDLTVNTTRRRRESSDSLYDSEEDMDLTRNRKKTRVSDENDEKNVEVDVFDLSEDIKILLPFCIRCYQKIPPPMEIYRCEKNKSIICGSCCQKAKGVCGQDRSGIKRDLKFEDASKQMVKYEISRKVDKFLEKKDEKKKIFLTIEL